MLKALGAVCVLCGALWCGLAAIGRLRERTRTLEALEGAMTYLEEELSFRLTPLPKLLGHLRETCSDPAAAFFGDVLAGLKKEPEGGLRGSWRRAAEVRLTSLRPEERQVVLTLGETLGRYDAQLQRQALAQAERRLGEYRRQAAGDQSRLGRVYAALSLGGGLMAVLVLL